MNKKTILVITDGIGYNPNKDFNAFANAKKPTYDKLFATMPNSKIATSGLSVGLPDGQMGNSEVGHMSIGSGRVMYQDLVRIDKAITDDNLKDNTVLKDILSKSKSIHLIGLCSDGGVHSHISHIIALAKISAKEHKVYIHIITDGRDVPPKSASIYIKQIQDICDENISIASIGGRFYAMDRDNNYDRVKKSFDCIYDGSNGIDKDIQSYIDSSYESGVFDEFIEPVSIGGYDGMKENDGIVFCNFRSDRIRELSYAIGGDSFNQFAKKSKTLHIATMTKYKDDFVFPIMFDKLAPKNTLAEVISNHNLTQFHTAETEKYAHVTFFLNGGVEEKYKGETHHLVPSPKVKTYDMKPQMSCAEVGESVLSAMDDGYDFIVVNFANGDMVGHTGVYEAGIEAVEAVDEQLGLIIDRAKSTKYNVLITSDHGNCEMMRDEKGNTLTNHTITDVFCFCIADGVDSLKDGGLNNIAPTVLKLMDIEIPKEMDEALV
jgi:2,3-bisphosphoglycerate-independent phosphoglycerate mutase